MTILDGPPGGVSMWEHAARQFEDRKYHSPWRDIARPGQLMPPLTQPWLIWLLMMGRGAGKAVGLDCPLPVYDAQMLRETTETATGRGWLKMADLRVGDTVFDETGSPTRVLEIHEMDVTQAWRLTFSDGTTIDACADHQWVTWTHAERKAYLRSPYENPHRFPPNWPAWRLRRLKGTQPDPALIQRALEMHAAGASVRATAAELGCARQALARHIHAGQYVAREPVVYPDSPGPQIRTTREIVATLTFGQRGDTNHCIPLAGPLDLPEVELPLDPWVLGYWLGNGHTGTSGISGNRQDEAHVRTRLADAGFATGGRYEASAAGGFTFTAYNLIHGLRAAGVATDKHVPDLYLWASESQRADLLAGLLDSDGYCDGANVEFVSMTRALADAVMHLARSLGQKPVLAEGQATLYGKDYGTKYRVTWRPTRNPFSSPRKSATVREVAGQGLRSHHRMIVAADPLPPQRMRCIVVDAPNRMFLAGEGMVPTHNSRSAAEALAELMRRYPGARVALVAATFADARDTMVEGDSGLLAVLDATELRGGSADRAWNRSMGELFLANGSAARVFSSEKPRKLRGPQHHAAWVDEAAVLTDAHYDPSTLDTTWSNLMLGLRLPRRPGWPADYRPRCIVTTTPRRVALLKVPASVAAKEPHRAGITQMPPDRVVITTGTTDENLDNLAPEFIANVVDPLRGTRLGRQEIQGQLLDDVQGALVQQEWIDRARRTVSECPPMAATVVAVDPAETVGEKSDETGIVATAVDAAGDGYVIADHSGRYSPEEWTRRTWDLALDVGAQAVIVEDNAGGDMVESALKTAWFELAREFFRRGLHVPPRPGIVRVHPTGAMQGKWIRAQPVALMYEQAPGRIHHVNPDPVQATSTPTARPLDMLEDQLTSWTGDKDEPSPDRVDALVHGLNWLLFPGTRKQKPTAPAASRSRWGASGRR